MAEDDTSTPQPPTEQPVQAPAIPEPPAVQPTPSEDRSELLERARTFLRSPQVVHEDVFSKRKFLVQKGLNDPEIETLLQELPPVMPPRTYPQPPPSNIPNLLTGVLRIISWVAGSSAVLLLAYFRFIYPRLSQSFRARLSLRTHQRELLTRLIVSLEATKAAKKETYEVLPKPQPYKEDPQFAICHTTEDISSLAEDSHDIPGQSLLRCAIEELTSKNEKATVEAIFKLLETKFPWVLSDGEQQNENHLWEILSTSPVFEHKEIDGATVWSFHAQPSPPPPPLLDSLTSLRSALPETRPERDVTQKTMQTLSDFTGYIASQTYHMPFKYSMGPSPALTPEEDEVRREIKALKGLVLNRRSFLPARPTPPSHTVS